MVSVPNPSKGGSTTAENLPGAPSRAATSPIETATASDAERIIAVVALAFSSDPAARWLYPDPDQYWTYWPEFVRAFGGGAFEYGTAHYADGYAGAALWFPPGGHPDDAPLAALLERSVAGHAREEVFAMLEQMGGYHPSEPHWYLPLMGVDPPQQGKGHGAALLKHALALCDRDHLPAYLENSNPRNKLLYERHGFEVVGTVQVGSSPPLWPMVRKPR